MQTYRVKSDLKQIMLKQFNKVIQKKNLPALLIAIAFLLGAFYICIGNAFRCHVFLQWLIGSLLMSSPMLTIGGICLFVYFKNTTHRYAKMSNESITLFDDRLEQKYEFNGMVYTNIISYKYITSIYTMYDDTQLVILTDKMVRKSKKVDGDRAGDIHEQKNVIQKLHRHELLFAFEDHVNMYETIRENISSAKHRKANDLVYDYSEDL